MPWYLFGLATRHKLKEFDYMRQDRDFYRDLAEKRSRYMRRQHGQIVQLRRELDNARNHVPLQGVVFNGEVL